MVGFFSKLFGKHSELFELASDSDGDAFATALGDTDITMLGAIDGDGLDSESMTQEELLAAIESAAENISARETFEPFVYEDEGSTFLPFFTSSKSAEIFCGAYSSRENRIFPFQTFIIKGADLASMVKQGSALIMDPQSDDEVVLSIKHVDALHAMWG